MNYMCILCEATGLTAYLRASHSNDGTLDLGAAAVETGTSLRPPVSCHTAFVLGIVCQS